MFAFALSLALMGTTPTVREEAEVPKAGAFGMGINLDVGALSLIQAFSEDGTATGLSLGLAVQIDVGPRLAVRLPLDMVFDVFDNVDRRYFEISFSPGLLYRWRTDPDQVVVPFAGLSWRLGRASFERAVRQEPFREDTRDFMTLLGPAASAGMELRPARWLALTAEVDYMPVLFDADALVHVLRERVGLRLSF